MTADRRKGRLPADVIFVFAKPEDVIASIMRPANLNDQRSDGAVCGRDLADLEIGHEFWGVRCTSIAGKD